MPFMQRLTRGVEAGLFAGGAVAFVFFVSDSISLTPLATPAALANALVADSTTVIAPRVTSAVGAVILGAGLLVYTVLHFAAFALLGIGAAFLLPTRPWTRSLGAGALYGLLACTAVFYGTRLVVGSPFAIEGLDLTTLLLTNVTAGVVMALVLYIHDAGDRAEKAPQTAAP